MSYPPSNPAEREAGRLCLRVLILAPVDGDSVAVSHVLEEGGFAAHSCSDIGEVAREVARDDNQGAGTVIISQEAFAERSGDSQAYLTNALGAQPGWSDLPLILLAGGGGSEDGAWNIARALDPVGNITILERPLRRTTLLNAVAVALRARARQYELRSTLRELADHREHLQELVAQKTADLAASVADLHAAERLASLGTLAAGLGHDIANLTLPIRARLDTLRTTAISEDGRSDIDAIHVALTHLGRLSAGMRLLGMDPARVNASAVATDLAEWMGETGPLLRSALPQHVRFESHIPPGLGVNVARHRLAQAVFNLVQNAGEAMGVQGAGEVRIRAEGSSEPAKPPLVRLSVSDDGPGMTPDTLARCFEPYFSTKGRAIATGMGLGMVKGIVEGAGGSISVASSPGEGTTFTLTLPALQAAPLRPAAPRAATGAITVSDGRIAGLARLFMDQLGLQHVSHRGPDAPSTLVWIVENPDPARVAAFLADDPRRHAVVLARSSGPGCVSHLSPEMASRVISLPDTPSPAALRFALSRASSGLKTSEPLFQDGSLAPCAASETDDRGMKPG